MSLISVLQVMAAALWLFAVWSYRRDRRALRANLLELADMPPEEQRRVLEQIAQGLREDRHVTTSIGTPITRGAFRI